MGENKKQKTQAEKPIIARMSAASLAQEIKKVIEPTIASESEVAGAKAVVTAVIEYLKTNDKRFDPDLFRVACGLPAVV